MDPVVVTAPPRSSYNQNRRVSDLLYNQLRHFQHVEMKRGDLGIDPEVARNVHTEAGAAKYIAAVTTALRGKSRTGSVQPPSLAVMPAPKPAAEPQPETGLDLAASAEAPRPSTGSEPKKTATKSSAAKTAKPRKGKP